MVVAVSGAPNSNSLRTAEFYSFFETLKSIADLATTCARLLEAEKVGVGQIPSVAVLQLQVIDYDGHGIEAVRLSKIIWTLTELHSNLSHPRWRSLGSSSCCQQTRGPSTPQNRSLRERFCSARDDSAKRGSGLFESAFSCNLRIHAFDFYCYVDEGQRSAAQCFVFSEDQGEIAANGDIGDGDGG
jgi:hypothetical protein